MAPKFGYRGPAKRSKMQDRIIEKMMLVLKNPSPEYKELIKLDVVPTRETCSAILRNNNATTNRYWKDFVIKICRDLTVESIAEKLMSSEKSRQEMLYNIRSVIGHREFESLNVIAAHSKLDTINQMFKAENKAMKDRAKKGETKGKSKKGKPSKK